MTIAKVFVTAAGLAAIVWVLWYFLAPLGSSRAPRSGSPR